MYLSQFGSNFRLIMTNGYCFYTRHIMKAYICKLLLILYNNREVLLSLYNIFQEIDLVISRLDPYSWRARPKIELHALLKRMLSFSYQMQLVKRFLMFINMLNWSYLKLWNLMRFKTVQFLKWNMVEFQIYMHPLMFMKKISNIYCFQTSSSVFLPKSAFFTMPKPST